MLFDLESRAPWERGGSCRRKALLKRCFSALPAEGDGFTAGEWSGLRSCIFASNTALSAPTRKRADSIVCTGRPFVRPGSRSKLGISLLRRVACETVRASTDR
jgi:hypothetical protein